MLDKYLLELLKAKNRVIIPKIGAFILRNDKVTFNSILKFDDGVLSGHIAQKEGIDKGSATKKIQDLTNEIEKTLEGGNQFPIEGVGSLYKDANGKIQYLESGKTGAADNDSKGKTKTAAKKDTSPKKETSSVKKEDEPIKTEPPKTTTPPPTTKKETPTKPEAKPSTPPPASKPADKKEPVKKAAPTTSKTTTTTTKKSGNKTFLWVSIIVLVIAGGVTAFLLLYEKDTVKEDPLFAEEELMADSALQNEEDMLAEAEEELDASEETTEEISTAGTEETSETEATTAGKTTSEEEVTSGPKYYVIAGCFQNEQYADSYAKKLRNEGYPDAKKFGKHKNMHAVCYSSHSSMANALQSLKKIRASKEPNAWLLKQ